MVDMVCELQDGICHLCGKDPHEDCPLIGLDTEVAEWADTPAVPIAAPWAICSKGACHRHEHCMYTRCFVTGERHIPVDFDSVPLKPGD